VTPKPFTRIYILGAGCSLENGYPLAARMLHHLRDFMCEIGPAAPRIRENVGSTISLMEQFSVETLDELVSHHEIRDDLDKVERAKVSMTALFAWKEGKAVKTGFRNYQRLFQRLFAYEYGSEIAAVLKETPYRVLTFNYDRIFELAFNSIYGLKEDVEQINLMLQVGLMNTDSEDEEPPRNGFSLVKLHGGVGFVYKDNNHSMEHMQSRLPFAKQEITDSDLYKNDGTLMFPLQIVFPHEKRKERANGQNTFGRYIDKTKSLAQTLLQEAREVWIVGYSIHPIDLPYFKELLGAAANCKQFVIQNPQAKTVGQYLETLREEIGFKGRILPYEVPF